MANASPMGKKSPFLASDDEAGTRRALATAGAAAVGTYVAGAVARRAYRQLLPVPASLPHAIDAAARTFEIEEGRTNFYVRPGTGTPIVLLHSFNAAASSFEMRPFFNHFAATSNRPIYAVDWLGFGRSARPNLKYTPERYLRQLRRFLQDQVGTSADIVGLSLGAEYAARVTLAEPALVQRLVLISPTGLDGERGPAWGGRLFLHVAACTGIFEVLYYALTRRDVIHRFYARQVFLDPSRIPDELVAYAHTTARVRGGHYAARRFVDGTLFPLSSAASVYARLYCPTLLVTPRDAEGLVQAFERTAEIVMQNAHDLTWSRLRSGLLPQWETPTALFDTVDEFLLSDDPSHAP